MEDHSYQNEPFPSDEEMERRRARTFAEQAGATSQSFGLGKITPQDLAAKQEF